MLEQIVTLFKQDPFAQSMGFFAYIISIYAFWFCKNKKFIKAMAVLSFFWAWHFYLIWAMSAFFVNFIDVFKAWFALKYGNNKKIAGVFLILYSIWGIFFYRDIISVLPIVLAIFWLYLTFFVRWIWLNLGYLIIVCFWFIYNIYNWSLWGMASDITLFVTWTYGIITMFLLKDKKELKK